MPEPLKNHINAELVHLLAERMAAEAPNSFDASAFVKTIKFTLADLELKDRINLVADTIRGTLDLDYPSALTVVVNVSRGEVGDWAAWPLCSFVERHGLDHPNESLAAMEHLTQAWSCEFAVRPFLEHHLELTRTFLRTWATSPNEHVRRLPSEGTRPLLPWGPKVRMLINDPTIGLELLTMLRNDSSETVRRSVANHLNDLAKANPDLVVETLTRWTNDEHPVEPKLVRHALRTLVKNGHTGALALLGFTTDPQLTIDNFSCSPTVLPLGAAIQLNASFTSTSEADQLLVVDFVIHHQTARGSTSPKVFKWTTVALGQKSTVTLTKKRPIKNVSTRTYFPGPHKVDLQIAGQIVASATFELET